MPLPDTQLITAPADGNDPGIEWHRLPVEDLMKHPLEHGYSRSVCLARVTKWFNALEQERGYDYAVGYMALALAYVMAEYHNIPDEITVTIR